jgi:Bacteriophage protein of unknown function (DUF646).
MQGNITFDDTATLKSFQAFIADANSKAPSIMSTAAEPLLRAARDKVQPSKSGVKVGKYAHPPGTLKNSIAIGVVYTTKYSVSSAVGIAKNQYFTQAPSNLWYARWYHQGTKGRTANNWWGHKGLRHSTGVMPANPFMITATRQTRNQIKNYIRYRLQEELFSG